MEDLQVTIVVVPREQFSSTQESLESIYEHTQFPFKLVYVDGNSPPKVHRYLKAQAQAKNFQLLRTDYYLSPNHARNIGLKQVDTQHVVFIDNDVVVSPGWLNALVKCADETGATVVGPLMCQHKPLHEIVHFAGGESRIITDVKGRQVLREKMYKQGQRVADVRPKLGRTQTELAEFHCVLVRTKIFEQIGPFDEAMLNTKEHLDFCMTVAKAGGSIYFEPDCLVTYVAGPLNGWSDLHFYMLRWSNAWTLNSLNHLREKWGLAENMYFKNRYKKLGRRRGANIVMPLSRRLSRLSFGFGRGLLDKALFKGEKLLNRYLTDRYAQAQLQRSQDQVQGLQHSALKEDAVVGSTSL